MSPKFVKPDASDFPQMLGEAEEMLEAAAAEHEAARLKAAASLAVNAAVRASDVICAAGLGYYSAAASHAAAIELVDQVSDVLADKLALVIANRSFFNYRVGDADPDQVGDALAAAATLVAEARKRLAPPEPTQPEAEADVDAGEDHTSAEPE